MSRHLAGLFVAVVAALVALRAWALLRAFCEFLTATLEPGQPAELRNVRITISGDSSPLMSAAQQAQADVARMARRSGL